MNVLRRALALTALVLAPAAAAQTVDDVFPLEPRDGGRCGPRGKFRIGIDGAGVLEMRFKIELSRDGFDTIAYTFDQQASPRGWAFIASKTFDRPGAVYFPQKPLDDGVYEWRTYAWNGVEWMAGKTVHRLVIDAVPPADVEGVRMRVDPEREVVVLDWDPVVLDREGRPEYVAKYHVYRYFRASFFFVIRTFHIGTVEDTHFEDTDPIAMKSKMVFYKVTAEDEAGNEADRRF
jgi:hypothetical protein